MRLSRLLVVIVASTALQLVAQDVVGAHTDHVSASADIIDGSMHPELIPDSSAYRLWFSTVSLPPNATDEQRAIQGRLLSPLQLNGSDYTTLTDLLATFNGRFELLIKAQADNARLASTQLRSVDDSDFFSSRESLVSEIRQVMKSRLSVTAIKSIDEFVQGEKRNMKLSPLTQ